MMNPSEPFSPSIVPLIADDDIRETALRRTRELLRDLVTLHRSLELPPSDFRLTVETFGQHVVAASIAKAAQERAAAMPRLPMQITSMNGCVDVKIRRKEPTMMITRPQWVAYRIEEIEIHGHPERWLVHDIKIGNRSQLVSGYSQALDEDRAKSQSGGPAPIPGVAFAKGAIMSKLKLETLQTAQDFTLVVEYVGPEDDGEVFDATIVGTAAI